MARIKGAMMTRKRRKKTLKLAKGYFGAKSKLFKMAKQQVMKSGNYAFIGRKQKKRNFRSLPHERHQLQHLHERVEEGRRGAQPEDAFRNRHQRRPCVCRAGGEGEGCSLILDFPYARSL